MIVKEEDFDFSDFDFSGFVQGDLYKNAISAASSKFDYWAYCEEFSKAVDLAKSSGETSHAEAFRILAEICSMVLCPEFQQNPFKSIFDLPTCPSMSPENFSEGQLSFLGSLIDVVDDVFVKARLGELLWLVEKPKNQKRAVVAVDSYLEMPLSPESWIWVKECWVRAIVLSTSLRESGKVDLIRDKFIGVVLSAEESDAGFLVGVARVLREARLRAGRMVEVAERLEFIASKAIDRDGKRDAFEEAAEWFGLGELPDRKASCMARVADIYAGEADEVLEVGEEPVLASALLEVAIKKYRSIPRKQRGRLDVDNKIIHLKKRQREIGEMVIEQMREFRISTDATEFVEKVKRTVGAKGVLDALILFVIGNAFSGVAKTRDQAVSTMKCHPLRWMFPGRFFSVDGRLLATHPPVSSYHKDDKAVEVAIVERFEIYVNSHVDAFVYPALVVIRNQHWLTIGDFERLARESPLVPDGRERIWAIGLHAGYEGNFVVALHILVPQIEHMVRVHLKNAGISTSTLGQDNLETENGLGTLVQCPGADKVFGEDILFELKYLLCSPLYANIRNEMAHGLLSYGAFYSKAAVYCWWLSLRLVLVDWWNGLAVEMKNEHVASMMKGGESGS